MKVTESAMEVMGTAMKVVESAMKVMESAMKVMGSARLRKLIYGAARLSRWDTLRLRFPGSL